MERLNYGEYLSLRLHERASQDNLTVETLFALLEKWLAADYPPRFLSSISPALILQQISDAVIMTDEKLLIGAWNAAAECIYGWTEAEALGQDIDVLLKTVWSHETQAQAQKTLHETGRWSGEIQQKTKDGTTRFIWASVSRLTNSQGVIVGGVTINHDITERKLAEEALRASEQRYRALFEQSNDAVFVMNLEGRTQLVNQRAAQMFGYTVEEMHQLGYSDLVVPPEHEQSQQVLQRLLANEQLPPYERTFRRKDDTQFLAEVNVELVRDEQGQALHLQSIVRDISHRQQANEALRKSEEKYRLIAENTSDGIVIVDAKTAQVIYASPTYDNQMGRAEGGSLQQNSQTIYELIHPEDRDETFTKVYAAIRQRKDDLTYAYRIKNALGAYIWREDHAKFIYDESGAHLYTYVIARDVTERKLSEIALSNSEARLRLLLDSQTMYVVRTDLQGNYTYANRMFHDTFAWIWADGETPIGKSTLDTILPEDYEKAIQTAQTCLQKPGRPVAVILRKIAPLRNIFWVFWEFTALTNESGEVNEIQCTGVDITELMHAREQLLLQQAALLATANAIAITNSDGIIEWVNPAFTSLTGYTLEDARGKKTNLLRSGVNDPVVYKELWDTILAGKVWQGRLVNKRKDGSLYIEEQTVTPVRDEHDLIKHFVAIKQDISEREEAEQIRLAQELLKTSLKKEQEFSALVQKTISALSHDVRTPLAVISTAKDLLSRHFNHYDETKRREKLDLIGQKLHYVTELLDDMAMVVKGQLNQRVFHPKMLNLDSLCQLCLNEIQTTTGLHHHFVFIPEGNFSAVTVDDTLVSRILLNLLSNAVKFSPSGSQIQLALARHNAHLIFRVTDEGIGISEADLAHIFDLFYRTESARHIHGTGIGLNTVKDCVERHHGTIHVESVVGQGTTFIVALPDGLQPDEDAPA